MPIESENAKEEVKDIVEKCIKCGLCKGLCPVFRILREETSGPRGKAIMLDEGIYDNIVFKCCMCRACEERCPLDIKLCEAFLKARQVLSESNKGSKESKEILKKFEKTGKCF